MSDFHQETNTAPHRVAPHGAASETAIPVAADVVAEPCVAGDTVNSAAVDPEIHELARRVWRPTGMTAALVVVSGLISIMLGSATGAQSEENIGSVVGAVLGVLMVVPVAAGIYCGFLRRFRRLPERNVTTLALRVMASGCVVMVCSVVALTLSSFLAAWNAALGHDPRTGDGHALACAFLATVAAAPCSAVIALVVDQAARRKATTTPTQPTVSA